MFFWYSDIYLFIKVVQSFSWLTSLLRGAFAADAQIDSHWVARPVGVGRLRWDHISWGGLVVVVAVEVLADQVLHVESAWGENPFKIDRAESDRHLSLVVVWVVRIVDLRNVHLLHVLLGLLSDQAVGLTSFLCCYLLNRWIFTLPSR